MSEQCSGCKFFGEVKSTDFMSGELIEINGMCRRNPVAIDKDETDWCGEFKAVDVGQSAAGKTFAMLQGRLNDDMKQIIEQIKAHEAEHDAVKRTVLGTPPDAYDITGLDIKRYLDGLTAITPLTTLAEKGKEREIAIRETKRWVGLLASCVPFNAHPGERVVISKELADNIIQAVESL